MIVLKGNEAVKQPLTLSVIWRQRELEANPHQIQTYTLSSNFPDVRPVDNAFLMLISHLVCIVFCYSSSNRLTLLLLEIQPLTLLICPWFKREWMFWSQWSSKAKSPLCLPMSWHATFFQCKFKSWQVESREVWLPLSPFSVIPSSLLWWLALCLKYKVIVLDLQKQNYV